MSSSPPAHATGNDEVLETVHGEAPPTGHAAAALEAAGAAANHTVSSPHEEANELNDGPDEYEDTDDEYDEDDSEDDEYDEDDSAEDTDDDVSDVDDKYLDGERVKFSESAEVEATVEALWRKVVAVDEKPPSAGHACSVCMEHLTCEGAHRIW